MANKNFRITVEYDGTDFHGWQRQRKDRTVQAEIEASISTMTRQKVVVHGSGRTDAGVHALGQTASFRCNTRLAADDFLQGLNALLPDDVAVIDCRETPADFHARYSASSKVYRYHILNRALPSAVERRFCWHVRRSLDLAAMTRATAWQLPDQEDQATQVAL